MTNPVFGLPHLSEDAVAAYADGVLSAAAASRAQRHCAECPECADAVRGQRETAMMLRAARAPSLPSGLLDRLAGLPMSTPLPPPSRGGLPTTLGADGTAMFIAHDARKARDGQGGDVQGDAHSGDARFGEQPEAVVRPPARPMHRRGALPVTVLASAAAVVAAGALGGQVSTLTAAANRQAPAGAANALGSLTGSQNTVLRAPSTLTSASTLLRVSRPSPSLAGPVDQAARPALRSSGQQATSVTLVPLAGPATASPSSGAAAAGSDRPARWSTDERPSAGIAPTMAGAPVATP
jgi:hypothetical protein